MLGVDLSNYGGELSADTVRRWHDAGVRRVVVGIYRNWHLGQRQLQAALDGGMEVEAYVYLYYAEDPSMRMDWVVSAIEGLPVRRVWLDFEDGDAPEIGYNTDALVCAWIGHCLQTARQRWADDMIGAYSGRWWWNPYTGSTTRFSAWPLWVADYDGVASMEFTPFGGWQTCAMKQYQGTTDFCGYSVDLNYYEEDDMTAEAFAALQAKADRTALLARWAGLILSGVDANIQTALGEMKVIAGMKGA